MILGKRQPAAARMNRLARHGIHQLERRIRWIVDAPSVAHPVIQVGKLHRIVGPETNLADMNRFAARRSRLLLIVDDRLQKIAADELDLVAAAFAQRTWHSQVQKMLFGKVGFAFVVRVENCLLFR